MAAVRLADAAVGRFPGKARAHLTLARALAAIGDVDACRARLDQACSAFPTDEDLHAERARVLAHVGEWDAARADARRWPESAWAAKLILKLNWLEGGVDAPRRLERIAAAADGSDPVLFELRAARLRDDPKGLLALCDEALGASPAMHALYYRAIALAMLGRDQEARAAMGTERFLRQAPLPCCNEPDFLAALEAEIRVNSTLHPDPAGQATCLGVRTRVFPLPSDKAAHVLVDACRTAVSHYADSLEDEHPFVLAKPGNATLTPWALVFSDRSHQSLHIHPGSWVTGVFYVSAPPGSPRPGRLRVGALPRWAGVKPPWSVLELEPTPGTLVVFPASLPHDTVPTESDSLRISVAFDVTAAPDRRS